MPLWAIERPIDFSAYGDRTFEAIRKGCIEEVQSIYDHLNYLKENSVSFANIALKGVADNIASLPASAALGDIWGVPGESQALFVWNGSAWSSLAVEAPIEATVDKAGLVTLGTLEGALGANPSLTKVIASDVLIQYALQGASGILPGAILIWPGSVDTIPDSYVLCDGTNGTPDLRGLFIRGAENDTAVGTMVGSDSITVPVGSLVSHTHTISANVNVEAHTHSYGGSNALASYTFTHGHTITAGIAGNTGPSGAHIHQWNPAGPYAVQDVNPSIASTTTGSSNFMLRYPVNAYLAGAHTHTGSASITINTTSPAHTHTFSGTTGQNGMVASSITGTTSNAQEDVTVVLDNIPPYKEVLYIMKKLVA